MVLGQSAAISGAVVDRISKTVMTHFPTWVQEMIAHLKNSDVDVLPHRGDSKQMLGGTCSGWTLQGGFSKMELHCE